MRRMVLGMKGARDDGCRSLVKGEGAGGIAAPRAVMMRSLSGQTLQILQIHRMRDEGEGSFNKSVDKMVSYQQSKLVLNFEL